MTPAPDFKSVFVPLLVVFLLCTILLLITDHHARSGIEKNAREQQLRVMDAVLPLPHDNDLYDDHINISTADSRGAQELMVFRARHKEQPVGVVLMPVTAAGYNGKIQLVMGIAYDGTLLGVRVLEHRESPGLGDRIEHSKSSWLENFTGRHPVQAGAAEWRLRADGGTINHLSGATITARGVTKAIENALEFYQAHRDRLYQGRGTP